MAYREKTAWLAIAAMAIAYGALFIAVALAEQAGTASLLQFLILFAIASAARVAIQFGGMLVVAARAPGDARAPADERDRAIARRGAATAYYVLMTGMILVGIVMPFNAQGWRIANAALGWLVAAELARYFIAVLSYRRGWHG